MNVEETNRSGRLHPSQRGKILDGNFWTAAVLAVAGIVGVVMLAGYGGSASLTTAVLVLVLVAWFAFVCLRRLREVRDGRLVAITGWTHDFGKVHGKVPQRGQYPIYLYTIMERIWFTYLVAEDRKFRLDDPALRERIQPERTNTVLLTPRSKLLVNVIPS